MADADVPQAEEEKGDKEPKEEKKEEEEENHELTEEERKQEEAIQKKLEEIMGRDPKPWPGDGKDLYESKDYIEFKWTKGIENRRQVDTICGLYLLQEALELVRKRTNERNKEFKRINRKDRFISHLDAPQILTHFLDWHNEDPEKNLFDGKLIYESDEMDLINNIINKIGKVKLGPSTKIVMKLKDVHVASEWYSKVPAPKLKLKTRGYDRLIKADKVIPECTLDEIITILMFKNDEVNEEKEAPEIEGIFALAERKKPQPPVTKEANWKESIVKYFRDNEMDGAKFMANDIKTLTQALISAVVPDTELNEKGKPRNTKLRGSVKGILNNLKGCKIPTEILAAATEQEAKNNLK